MVILAIGAAYILSISSGFRDIVITGTSPSQIPTARTAPTAPVQRSAPTDAAITLRDVKGGTAAGQGSRKLAEGVYNIGVRAQKLAPPIPGNYYRAWLIRGVGSYDGALSLDALRLATNGPNKGDYLLGVQLKEDARVYGGMIITLQPMSDAKPSNVVLEGAFK